MAVGRAMCCRCTTGPSGNPTDGTKAVEEMADSFWRLLCTNRTGNPNTPEAEDMQTQQTA